MNHHGRVSANHNHVWWWKCFCSPTCPLLTQSHKTRLAFRNFFQFVTNFLCCGHKFSLMEIFTPAGKFKDSGFICFNFFLFINTRLECLRQLSFKKTFFGEPWQRWSQELLVLNVLLNWATHWKYIDVSIYRWLTSFTVWETSLEKTNH